MIDFLSRPTTSDFLRSEFKEFVETIVAAKTPDDTELDAWVRHFDKVVEHPKKRDLIYWPEDGADDSPEGIVAEIERYCRDNGLPGFKDSGF